jgi:hypothetical protein
LLSEEVESVDYSLVKIKAYSAMVPSHTQREKVRGFFKDHFAHQVLEAKDEQEVLEVLRRFVNSCLENNFWMTYFELELKENLGDQKWGENTKGGYVKRSLIIYSW